VARAAAPAEEAAAPEPAPAPAPAKARVESADESLDRLLAGALDAVAVKPAKAKAGADIATEPGAAAEGPPAQAAIDNALKRAHRHAGDCYQKFHQEGVVDLKVAVAPDGSARALAFGDFAATPTGSCVEGLVRATKFPKSSAGTRFDHRISVRP
jgi:hypothetical protein